MATTVVSMATKSSDLEDQTSGANLQTPMPLRGQKDPEEMEALYSVPSCLPPGLQPGSHHLVTLTPGTV